GVSRQHTERSIPQNKIIVARTHGLRAVVRASLGCVEVGIHFDVLPLAFVHRVQLVRSCQKEVNWVAVQNVDSDIQFAADWTDIIYSLPRISRNILNFICDCDWRM